MSETDIIRRDTWVCYVVTCHLFYGMRALRVTLVVGIVLRPRARVCAQVWTMDMDIYHLITTDRWIPTQLGRESEKRESRFYNWRHYLHRSQILDVARETCL